MQSFLDRFSAVIRGILSGLDRVFFRGTLRSLAYTRGIEGYLWANHILFKDFARHSVQVTARLQEASLRRVQELGREVRYLNSSQVCKEDIAREIAARGGLPCEEEWVVPSHSGTPL
jgi:hypothetical protein